MAGWAGTGPRSASPPIYRARANPLRRPEPRGNCARMADDQKPDYGTTLQAQLIADYVTNGETLIDACRTLGVDYSTTFKRIRENPLFAEMMEEARSAGYDVIANNVRRVIRGVEGYSSGDVKRDKLIAETDLKLLSKWHPKGYGDKLLVEQKTATVAIPVTDDPIAAQRAYEDLMKL